MEKLPGDLVSNLLIRLPAKLLAQMRCVSKPWNALLSRPSFIKSRLDRSIYNNDEVLLVFDNGIQFTFEPFTAHHSQSPHLELTNFLTCPFDYLSRHIIGGRIIGSVNGLVCLSFGYDNLFIHIWNPSLSAVITLPPYTIPRRADDASNIPFSFGYDPKTDDYKVVKITGRHASHRRFGFTVEEWLPVEVYSMRKGSWKLISERVPSRVTMIANMDEVCVDGQDGHLHWLGYIIDRNRQQQTIVALDLGIETFSEIPLPATLAVYNTHCSIALSVLAGKLCLISAMTDSVCEVWVMDDYGVADSWVKHHVFSKFTNIYPFGFTLHNEFLFETYKYRLALYDPIAAKVKQFKSMPSYRDTTKVAVYVDSLVWVAPTKNVLDHSTSDGS